MLYLLPSCLTNFQSMHLGFYKKSVPVEMDSQIRRRERGDVKGGSHFGYWDLNLCTFMYFL